MNDQELRIIKDDLRNAAVPCGDCSFEDDMSNIDRRVTDVEKLIQLRNEEDIRMAERFDALRQGQDRIEAKTDGNTKAIQEVRDIAQKNNRDLNNGLKSKVNELCAEQMKIADALQSHVLTTPSESQRREEIKRVHEEQSEEAGKKKHRTIERLATLIGIVIALDAIGVFDWLAGSIAAAVGG